MRVEINRSGSTVTAPLAAWSDRHLLHFKSPSPRTWAAVSVGGEAGPLGCSCSFRPPLIHCRLEPAGDFLLVHLDSGVLSHQL